MYVLDTDVLSLLTDSEGPLGTRVRARVAAVPPGTDVVTSIVSYEEQTRGWFAVLAKAKSIAEQISAYARLNRHLNNYRRMIVLPFDERAAVEFQRLKAARIRIGTADLKIAGIVLARSATPVTRNLADFRRVPGIALEDWAA